MKHGFIFTGTDPNLAVELAPLAEASGWDAFFVWEGIWATDPWATLAAAAMVTERIRLGTMLTPVPRRRPWELAGQTMTVDRLSNGRVILSAGLGVPAEFEQRFWIFEDDPGRKVRAELLDEGLEMLQHLWQGQPFSYEGEHFHAEPTDTMLPPAIVQQPRIPTWVVGVWPRMKSMRRVARYDGWIPNYAPPNAAASIRSSSSARTRPRSPPRRSRGSRRSASGSASPTSRSTSRRRARRAASIGGGCRGRAAVGRGRRHLVARVRLECARRAGRGVPRATVLRAGRRRP